MNGKTWAFVGFPDVTDRVTEKQPPFHVVNFKLLGIDHLGFDSHVIMESRLLAAGKRGYFS